MLLSTVQYLPFSRFSGRKKIALIVTSLVGFIFFDIVYMATTLNYTVQSEMIIWLLKAVTSLLYKNDYVNIDAAIKVCRHAILIARQIYSHTCSLSLSPTYQSHLSRMF